jgi:hypothetical protein
LAGILHFGYLRPLYTGFLLLDAGRKILEAGGRILSRHPEPFRQRLMENPQMQGIRRYEE